MDEPFADVWKTIRGYDTPLGGTAPPPLDASGWPTGDFKSVLWDGGAVEGDQSGIYKLTFNGRADVTIDAVVKGAGGSINFNPDYILEALRVSQLEQVRLDMSDDSMPAKFTLGESFTYVVMPISGA